MEENKEMEIPERLCEWPSWINLKVCKETLEQNQKIILEKSRSEFCKKILKATEMSEPEVLLEFPVNLFNKNKMILISELINNFGSVTIYGKTENALWEHNFIKDIEEVPSNPQSVKIIFVYF